MPKVHVRQVVTLAITSAAKAPAEEDTLIKTAICEVFGPNVDFRPGTGYAMVCAYRGWK